MNNEPVAWKVTETDDEGSFTTFTEVEPVWTDNAIPLYTHPAATMLHQLQAENEALKAKTLTDEEFTQLYIDFEENYTGTNFPVDLGRAILRKAREK